MGEVNDAEHRRRFRRHLERTAANRSPGRRRPRTEQNREAFLSPKVKDEPAHAVSQQGIRRALESWRPQLGATRDRPAPPPAPRPLEMTPRRLGRLRRLMGSDWLSQAETVRQVVEHEDMASSSPLRARSPELPPPFSRTVRIQSATYTSAPISTDDRDDSDFFETPAEEWGSFANMPTNPPATPVRHSSLSMRANIRSWDGQAEDRPNNDHGPVSARTRSRRHRDPVPDIFFPDLLPRPTTPRRSANRAAGEASLEAPNTGLARLRIYNDSLPRSFQPETPQNLPESRHQSRLHGAYTAPARRHSPLQRTPITPVTIRRWRHASRVPSPMGLQTPGFLGLYGGLENTDDEVLHELVAGRDQQR